MYMKRAAGVSCSVQLAQGGTSSQSSPPRGADLLSLTWGRTGGNGTKLNEGSSGCNEQKVVLWGGARSLEQAPRGSAHSTKPGRVRGASGPCSGSYGLVLGGPARSRELDLIHMGHSQLEMFCDAVKLLWCRLPRQSIPAYRPATHQLQSLTLHFALILSGIHCI